MATRKRAIRRRAAKRAARTRPVSAKPAKHAVASANGKLGVMLVGLGAVGIKTMDISWPMARAAASKSSETTNPMAKFPGPGHSIRTTW